MKLFERIRYLSTRKRFSLSKIAKSIDVPQQTFHQWLKPGSEKNLWEHLPKILELFPDVRPEWVYMGQEPAFKDGTEAEPAPPSSQITELQLRIEELEQELRESNRLNRQLTTRLLLDGGGDKEGQTLAERAAG